MQNANAIVNIIFIITMGNDAVFSCILALTHTHTLSVKNFNKYLKNYKIYLQPPAPNSANTEIEWHKHVHEMEIDRKHGYLYNRQKMNIK